jgi:signal transduction histidine kinase
LRRHDGVYRWVLDNGIPRYSPEGHFLGYLGGCIDITDRREAEDTLERFSRKLISAQESERQRIGQELHDDLGQRVVALSMGIHQLAQQMPENKQLNSHCAQLQQDASAIISDIARLSYDLRPVALDSLNLAAALQTLCNKTTDENGVIVRFSEHGQHSRNALPTSSIALYRVAQEALRNGLTHSGADRIDIRLVTTEAIVTVVIADNGCGFDPESVRSVGLGLSGMAERMKGVVGVFSIVSNPGVGTTITASASVAESAKPAAG